MSDKAFFISDLHLGSAEEPNALLLLEFLKSFQNKDHISHLFLVGDIYDLWIANYDYFRKKFALINSELVRLVNMGVEVHYFEGNHDLYLQHYFGKKLGLKIHEGPAYFEICGKTIRVEHGDEMDLEDHGYLFLRRILRSDFMKWLAPGLPEKFIVWLGNKMSSLSRTYTSKLKTISTERARRVIRQHAERVLGQDTFFDMLICGHVHVVEDVEIRKTYKSSFKMVRLINLGAWFDGPRVFVVDSSGARFLDLK